MQVITYRSEDKASILAEALVILLSGGTIVYPTETAYGLGADFFSPKAYRSVFAIKSREGQKPLPVIVPDLQYATTLVAFPPKASELAARYWPGPLTLVLPFLYGSHYGHHRDSHLALRVSSHPFAAALARAFGKPIISTSANMSGGGACYRIENVLDHFKRSRTKPDLIIDFGSLPETPPSTIVRVDPDSMRVLRAGAIPL